MERADTEPPMSEDCFDFLVQGLLHQTSDDYQLSRQISSMLRETNMESLVKDTSLGAEFDTDPDDKYSIKIQKVPVTFGSGGTLVPTSFRVDGSPPLLDNEVKVLPMVPSNMEFPGNYKFSISFEEVARPLTKSTPWVHSERLKKLFVRKEVPCPIRFKTEVPPPSGSYIRALMMFCKMEDINEVVCRCLRHEKRSPDGDVKAPHVLTCSGKDVVYEKCPKSGRYSVRFPVDCPQAGTDFFVKIFQFICYTSCVGGMNRRQAQIIFTLEHCGQTLGRRKVECRICACPGRDINNAEQALEKKIKAHAPSRTPPRSPARSPTPTLEQKKEEEEAAAASTDEISSEDEEQERNKKRKRAQETPTIARRDSGNIRIRCDIEKLKVRRAPDDEPYVMIIRGRENFIILSKLKESLELRETLSSDYVHSYRNTMPPSGRLQDFLSTIRTSSNKQASPPAKKAKREEKGKDSRATKQSHSTHTLVRADVQLPTENGNDGVEFERSVLQRTITLDKLERDLAALVKQEEDHD